MHKSFVLRRLWDGAWAGVSASHPQVDAGFVKIKLHGSITGTAPPMELHGIFLVSESTQCAPLCVAVEPILPLFATSLHSECCLTPPMLENSSGPLSPEPSLLHPHCQILSAEPSQQNPTLLIPAKTRAPVGPQAYSVSLDGERARVLPAQDGARPAAGPVRRVLHQAACASGAAAARAAAGQPAAAAAAAGGIGAGGAPKLA